MREKKNYRIITFHTTSAAMAMEKYCGENHINGRLIPVPRQLSADCGLAWRMEPAEYEQKKEQIHTFGIETDQSVELVEECANLFEGFSDEVFGKIEE